MTDSRLEPSTDDKSNTAEEDMDYEDDFEVNENENTPFYFMFEVRINCVSYNFTSFFIRSISYIHNIFTIIMNA